MITPESLAAVGTESAHQQALFCFFALHRKEYPETEWMFAIPNGGERNPIVAAKLKAEGVKAGVPDIFLPCSGAEGKAADGNSYWHPGLFIELKVKKNKLSKEQGEYVRALTEAGFVVMICYGWEAARDVIIKYLRG